MIQLFGRDHHAIRTPMEPRRTMSPRFAAADHAQRLSAIARLRAFAAAYRTAFERWRQGLRAVFPAGTYGLRVYARVACAPLASTA